MFRAITPFICIQELLLDGFVERMKRKQLVKTKRIPCHLDFLQEAIFCNTFFLVLNKLFDFESLRKII